MPAPTLITKPRATGAYKRLIARGYAPEIAEAAVLDANRKAVEAHEAAEGVPATATASTTLTKEQRVQALVEDLSMTREDAEAFDARTQAKAKGKKGKDVPDGPIPEGDKAAAKGKQAKAKSKKAKAAQAAKALTSAERADKLVAERGFGYTRGRVYLTVDVVEAFGRVRRSGTPEVLTRTVAPTEDGKVVAVQVAAVSIFRADDGSVAVQNLRSLA